MFMKLLFKSFLLIFSLLLFINSCSKDSPIPDAVVPTPNLIVTLSVTASEGGTVSSKEVLMMKEQRLQLRLLLTKDIVLLVGKEIALMMKV